MQRMHAFDDCEMTWIVTYVFLSSTGTQISANGSKAPCIVLASSSKSAQLSLTSDERRSAAVAQGALTMNTRRVREVMTPLEDVYCLEDSSKLNFGAVREIFQQGFSRIPVYGQSREDILGLLLVKAVVSHFSDRHLGLKFARCHEYEGFYAKAGFVRIGADELYVYMALRRQK